MYIGFWLENVKEREYFVELDVDGRIILKRIVKTLDGITSTGFIWLRMSTSNGIL
jgi:hypothetical protein